MRRASCLDSIKFRRSTLLSALSLFMLLNFSACSNNLQLWNTPSVQTPATTANPVPTPSTEPERVIAAPAMSIGGGQVKGEGVTGITSIRQSLSGTTQTGNGVRAETGILSTLPAN